jgi:hypothetical protein
MSEMSSGSPLGDLLLLAETLARLKMGVERKRDPRAYDRRNQEIREIERRGLEAIQHDLK